MNTFYLKPSITIPTGKKSIYVAQNGQGYVENKEIHIIGELHHFLYKKEGNITGWFMRNPTTNEDLFLGENASPTVLLENIDVKDTTYWESIICTPEQDAENIENPQETQEE